ncbi:MAG: ribonuclease HII [Oscillospiraceae bacterium]|nr:ribonuclease HII [Oscillospiraceae bacterium]
MDASSAELFFQDGFELICGVDEAGRGPLAGPVCVSAVILPKDFDLPFLDDSKKLSEKRREELFDEIRRQASDFSVVFVDEKRIDKVNILQATLQGMRMAVDGLTLSPDLVLVDGDREPKLKIPTKCIVKGDSKIPAIAAASVLAKVTRDRFMCEIGSQYPEYLFEKHKGYGTLQHMEAISEFGLCDVHRRSFCKRWTGE